MDGHGFAEPAAPPAGSYWDEPQQPQVETNFPSDLPPWASPQGEDLPAEAREDEIPPAVRKVGAFLPKDGHVTRQQAIEYINLQRWAREGCCQILFATGLWLTFLLLVNLHSHIEVSYDVYKDITASVHQLKANDTRGVAPAAIFSAAGQSMCSCSCPAICQGALFPTGSSKLGVPNGAPLFNGTVQPDQLQTMRAKANYLKNLGLGVSTTQKTLSDVNSIDDVWFWLQHGLVPELWHEEPRSNPVGINLLFAQQSALDAYNNALDPSLKPGHILRWNKVIGGMRLRQRRLKSGDCRVDTTLADFFKQICHKQKESKSPFGPGTTAYAEGFVPNKDDRGAFDIYLNTGRPVHIALETLQYMLKAHKWLDSSTDSLQMQVPFLNVEATPALYGLMEIRFDFTRSGTLEKKVDVWTAAASPYAGWSIWYLPDIMFFGLLIYLLIKKMVMTTRYFLNKGQRHDTLCNFWFMFDFFTIFNGIVLIIVWFYVVGESGGIGDSIKKLPNAPPWDAFQTVISSYEQKWADVLDRISNLLVLRDWLRVLQFTYTAQLIFQFMKGFRGQSKLAQITRTLINAAEDLIHFVLAFVVLFLSFAFTGHLVWGLRLKSWSSSTECVNATFRALMGDIELIEMFDIAPVTTVIWFWLFLWSMIFVMNNLLLATLYDHFQIVKAQANTFTTFLLQAKDVVRDIYHREGCKMFFCRCCCRCRREPDFPSHDDMLEELMFHAGYSPEEKHQVFRTVLGPKWMRKSTEKHVFAGEVPAEHLSIDAQAPAEEDLKRLGVDQDYMAELLDDIINYREREFDTEEIHINQMRELVTLAEVEMAAMRKRLQDCQGHMRNTMHDLVRRLESLEKSVHGSLQDLVYLASAAGIPDKVEGDQRESFEHSVQNNVGLSKAYRRVMQHLAAGHVKRLKSERARKQANEAQRHKARQQSNTYARLHNKARLAHAGGPEELRRMHRAYDMR